MRKHQTLSPLICISPFFVVCMQFIYQIIPDNAINLNQLNKFLKTDIDLKKKGYDKLLGKGKVTKKYNIIVKSFSKKAKEKIEKLGGTIKQA